MKFIKKNIKKIIGILAVVLICGFLFVNGFPAIAEIGPLKFLTGVIWKPQEGEFGILPMIIGSIYATGIAILVGVPIGLLCSVFMARFCPLNARYTQTRQNCRSQNRDAQSDGDLSAGKRQDRDHSDQSKGSSFGC